MVYTLLSFLIEDDLIRPLTRLGKLAQPLWTLSTPGRHDDQALKILLKHPSYRASLLIARLP